MINLIQEGGYFGGKATMDIYIVRKCKVEMKEFPGSNGAKYQVPVIIRDDVHSYVVQQELSSLERDKIQRELEDFYRKH